MFKRRKKNAEWNGRHERGNTRFLHNGVLFISFLFYFLFVLCSLLIRVLKTLSHSEQNRLSQSPSVHFSFFLSWFCFFFSVMSLRLLLLLAAIVPLLVILKFIAFRFGLSLANVNLSQNENRQQKLTVFICKCVN